MPSPLQNAGVFLVSIVFDLYIFVLLVRILLAAVRADYFNPLSQMVIKVTQPIIRPLRRVIPNIKNLELASVVVVYVLEIVKFVLIGLMLNGAPNMSGIFVLALADALKSFINLLFYALILQAIMTWMNQGYSPVANLLNRITAPVLSPFRRFIPPIGGMDISPIPAMILLQLSIIVVIGPLFAMGWAMSFS
jgi:YggT family protein